MFSSVLQSCQLIPRKSAPHAVGDWDAAGKILCTDSAQDSCTTKFKMSISGMRHANVHYAKCTCTVYLPQTLSLLFLFTQTFVINLLLEKLPEFMLDGSVFHMSVLYSIWTILHTFLPLSYFLNVILFRPSQRWRWRSQYSSHNY